MIRRMLTISKQLNNIIMNKYNLKHTNKQKNRSSMTMIIWCLLTYINYNLKLIIVGQISRNFASKISWMFTYLYIYICINYNLKKRNKKRKKKQRKKTGAQWQWQYGMLIIVGQISDFASKISWMFTYLHIYISIIT